VNIIQVEFGPSSVFPREGEVSDTAVRDTLALLDRASKANVAVNLLIYPHHFPQWMLDKYPHLQVKRRGFLKYSLHALEGQELLRRFLEFHYPAAQEPSRAAQHLPEQRANQCRGARFEVRRHGLARLAGKTTQDHRQSERQMGHILPLVQRSAAAGPVPARPTQANRIRVRSVQPGVFCVAAPADGRHNS
jgi:hypothetical protein